jgi:Ca-activated chloride channel family protein
MSLEAFHFLRPAWLLALALLAPLAWWWRRQRSEAGGWRAACDPHLLPHLLVPGRGRAAIAPFALLALGWSGACVAMAGPTWERLPQPAFGDPGRTVFVLSLAPSMDRDDVAPSRLARARHKLGDAIDRLEGGSVGLVVFREEAYGAVPLTDDADVVREMLPRLRTDLAPGREVLPSRGLAEAGRLLDAVGAAGARIVLVSDGSDASPQATLDAARALSRAGATVSVLSLAPDDATAASEVAGAGGGAFARLSADDADLERVLAPDAFAALGGRLARSEHRSDEWWDVGAWLVWLPLLLASLAFRRGWITAALTLAWIGLPSAPAQAGVADWFQRPDQRAAQAFETGAYAESAASFEDPSWRAAALYRAGNFEQAAEELAPFADERSQYNLGNALARAGKLDEALAAYDRSLATAPGDEDARFNRELVQRLLEEQRQQPSDAGGAGADGDQRDDEKGEQGRDDARNDQGGDPKEPGDAGSDPDDGQSQAGEQPASQQDAQDRQGADAGEGAAAPRDDPSQAGGGSEEQRADASAEGERSQARPSDASDAAPGATQPGDARVADAAPDRTGASPDARSPTDPWLAHLPDDPGGLLREKLRRDYLRKREARLRGELQ